MLILKEKLFLTSNFFHDKQGSWNDLHLQTSLNFYESAEILGVRICKYLQNYL